MPSPREGDVALVSVSVDGKWGALAAFRFGNWWTDAEIGGGSATGRRHDPDEVTVHLVIGSIPEEAL